jgi:hypothetical protein
MHAAADTAASLRRRLLQAFARRRLASWLLPLLPAAVLAAKAPLPALCLAALSVCWAGIDFFVWRRRIVRSGMRWLDAAVPALEDSAALLESTATSPLGALQRARLLARLQTVLDAQALRAIVRGRVGFNAIPVALALTAATGAWAYQAALQAPVGGNHGPSPSAASAATFTLTLHAEPPAYTGVQPSAGAPRDLQVPQHTALRWCARGRGTAIEFSDGQQLTVADGQCAASHAADTMFWRSAQIPGQRFTIRVTPDQAPQVQVLAPTEAALVLPADAQSALIDVSASDDYAVVRATLHMTLARGSGENIRFSDREVPLPAGADPHQRRWSRKWSLHDLGMEPGDELYFFVRASDNAPGAAHTTQSPTYTLRLPGPQAESLDSTALPSMVKPENLRSQRQIILDTEQLLAEVPRLAAAELRSRSESIATDQATLRRRYGQFLGEESTLFGDDEHEHGSAHKSDIVAQYGHVHDVEDNATIFDPETKSILRRALSAMWDAEKALRAITPRNALAPEYKALDAIKTLQQAERVYLHRTAFVPPAIKEDKRLSGDLTGAASYRRAPGVAAEVVSGEVRALMQALADDGSLPALWSKTALDAVSHITVEEQRLAAQRAVQDVQDGCLPCRAALRAWLRGTLTLAPPLLQAQPMTPSRFERALHLKDKS